MVEKENCLSVQSTGDAKAEQSSKQSIDGVMQLYVRDSRASHTALTALHAL